MISENALNDPHTLHPFQIEDAREAAHRASELQREVEDEIRTRSRAYANAECRYRAALAVKMLELAAGDPEREIKPVAATVTETLARGDTTVAALKEESVIAKGELDAAIQQAYRRGADRQDLGRLIDWSMKRDLRTDTPPPAWDRPDPEPEA